jgi:tricorn protease-like protein
MVFFASTSTQKYVLACGVNGRYWRWASDVGEVQAMDLTRDGKLLAVANQGGHVLLLRVDTLDVVQRFERAPGGVAFASVAFTKDEQYLLAGTTNGTLLIFAVVHPS